MRCIQDQRIHAGTELSNLAITNCCFLCQLKHAFIPHLSCWCNCSLTCFSLNELSQDVPPLTFTNILLITYKLISTCCSFSLPQPIFSVLAGWQSQILLLWLVIQFYFFKHSSFFLPSYQPTLLILFPPSSSHIHPWQEPLPQQLPIPTFVPPFLIPQPLQRRS